jgi:DNA topoisomerase-1
MMKVVVVESPAKAKTINRYLGDGYKVLASYGHICDLPSKDGSVLPENNFEMKWQVSSGSDKHLKEIMTALKGAEKLVLATDPDREGEAISWHVLEQLRQKNTLDGISIERVVFNEVTKSAIMAAMDNPRELDTELINAYRARRALDYLVGFSISPVLWRKLPGSRSAGRVQSVALRLICEREAAIEVFKSEEYWSIWAKLGLSGGGEQFRARLTHLDGEKIEKLSIKTEPDALRAVEAIRLSSLAVRSVEQKRVKRNPQPPFTTSTLQQEASRKLGFSATRTMQVAQKLYEGINIGSETTGLITYMRTDGVQLGSEAVTAIRSAIAERFGSNFVPSAPRAYKTKAANAQEAHEAIRPTNILRDPGALQSFLDHDQFRLYELIWKRTIASQMASAELDQTTIDIANNSSTVTLRANGQFLVFSGFLSVYQESKDVAQESRSSEGDDDDNDNLLLPKMTQGDELIIYQVTPEQHFTQPPPRFTDASLVKRMEELGIGRPSTYASIIQVLQNRNYVRKDRSRFIPEDRGRLVSTFLENFFDRYVEYDFTAELETQLDEVSAGKLDWTALLHHFWHDFNLAIDKTKDLTITNVLDVLDEELGPHFFKTDKNGSLVRNCPNCQDGRLGLKLGKFGAFVGCSNYPECKFTRQLNSDNDNQDENGQPISDQELGPDPETGLPVMLRIGPYGPYVQIGDIDTKKPKRASLPKGTNPVSLDLEAALALLALPRDIEPHPETGEMIQAGIGRFGPYLKYRGKFTSLPVEDDVLTIGINRAVDLLAEAAKKAGRFLGEHPSGGEVHIKAGRFGPYVEHNKLRATIGKDLVMDEITLETAIELLAAKATKGTSKKTSPKKNTAAKKKSAAKVAGKKKVG